MKIGDFILMLHSHIPYCKMAGDWPFGEEWLYEAMAEVYIPIIKLLREKNRTNIGFNFSFTPVLLEQLSDPYIQEKFTGYLDMKANLAKQDVTRFKREAEEKKSELAQGYADNYESVKIYFNNTLDRNIISELRKLQDEGRVEIITSSATHAYLPLFKDMRSVKAQIDIGCNVYEKHFKRPAKGIWLPECGFKQELSGEKLSKVLEDNGIEYFFVDTHSIIESLADDLGGSDGIKSEFGSNDYNIYDAYSAYTLKDSNIKVLVRDAATAVQVWSRDWGYPGDGAYREFHKNDDISGMKYWRVTSHQTDMNSKELYDSISAEERVKVHACHFTDMLKKCLKDYKLKTGDKGVIIAPFDSELFGHWWNEGVGWLDKVFEILSAQDEISASTASSYLSSQEEELPEVDLIESSWGRGGKHDIWLNEHTSWMWDRIYECESLAGQMLDLTHNERKALSRIASQATREYLLMSSSDWPFLVTTQQALEYAKQRFLGHYNNFIKLKGMADDNLLSSEDIILDEAFLSHVELSDSAFSQENMM